MCSLNYCIFFCSNFVSRFRNDDRFSVRSSLNFLEFNRNSWNFLEFLHWKFVFFFALLDFCWLEQLLGNGIHVKRGHFTGHFLGHHLKFSTRKCERRWAAKKRTRHTINRNFINRLGGNGKGIWFPFNDTLSGRQDIDNRISTRRQLRVNKSPCNKTSVVHVNRDKHQIKE